MPGPRAATAEYHDKYSETLRAEFRKLEDALLSDTVSVLGPREPLRLDETASIEEALEAMLSQDSVAVVVVDREGRLSGIATDRDLLKLARDRRRDAGQVRLAEVMTRDPEALRPEDRRDRDCRRRRQVVGRAVPRDHLEPAAGRPAEAAGGA